MAYRPRLRRIHPSEERPLRVRFLPRVWKWLEHANAAGVVHSVEAVYNTGRACVDCCVNRWATNSPDYEAAAKSEFAAAADSFLIGHAFAGEHTVVTHEVISDGRRRTKIPNASIANGVPRSNPFQMLRAESTRFVLGA